MQSGMARLRLKIRRLVERDAVGQEETPGEINVVPFLDIITNVMMFVLATVAVTFTSTIETHAVAPGARRPDRPSIGLNVIVVPEGFAVKARGGNVAPGCRDAGEGLAVPRHDDAAYDYAALKTCAARLKASAPDFAVERDVTISASPQIPYEVVIATFDAVRRSDSGDELFPEVSLGIAR